MSTERRCDGSEPSLRIIHLTNVSSTAGPYFAEEHVGRGAAFRDFDNDSDWDAVVVNNDEPAVLLRKDTEKTEHWVQLDLHGDGCNRDAIGTRIRITSGDFRPDTVRTLGRKLSLRP